MITLPSVLQKVMESNNLAGLKPFAYLFRNKWDSVAKKYALESTPIDISEFIVKPNTLSMKLDVNEVAQYNANNVTITLADTDNRFVEGTPNSYFPAGYQIYGSRVVLYYGLDSTNQTSIFTGVIKDLPTYKPEKYQVDLKLVSPLEMLKDIEAKDFSDKVTGEELHYEHQDDDSHRVYSTAETGVGGFDAVYADDNKLFEGVDYEVSQTNQYGVSALVTIINDNYQNATITADYYTWKTGLTVEQIIAGLVGLAGYDSGTEDIRSVVWNTGVRTELNATFEMSIGYRQTSTRNYEYCGGDGRFWDGYGVGYGYSSERYNVFPSNWEINFKLITCYYGSSYYYQLGQFDENKNFTNGFRLGLLYAGRRNERVWIDKITNGVSARIGDLPAYWEGNTPIKIRKEGTNIVFSTYDGQLNSTIEFDINDCSWNEQVYSDTGVYPIIGNYSLTNLADNAKLEKNGIIFNGYYADGTWVSFNTTFNNSNSQYALEYRTSDDGTTWNNWFPGTLDQTIGEEYPYIQVKLQINTLTENTNLDNCYFYILGTSLVLYLVNLSGKSVLEALQDFALISGYEFGVNRNGVFFFRPRVQSTNPIYTLGADELVKIDTVKRNLSDFFTKLTLTFAQVPLEFYANTGTRPTPVDKYGVINKEIDKPDIVNYDNPELAQAIGPQLLEIYSALPNMLQAVGKLNLALELADIVQVDRNYNLVQPDSASDYDKYVNQQTYYRACKITGMNYNFEKKQITYTLRDVSNNNNVPYVSAYGFVYSLPIRLGTRK